MSSQHTMPWRFSPKQRAPGEMGPGLLPGFLPRMRARARLRGASEQDLYVRLASRRAVLLIGME